MIVDPALCLVACLLEHLAPDGEDEPGLLGQPDEARRRQDAQGGVLPAHERFDADDLPVACRYERLVVDGQLLLLDGAAQPELEVQPFHRPRDHGGRIEAGEAVSAEPLGLVHGDICVVQDVVRGRAGRGDGDPDADAGGDRAPAGEGHRGTDGLDDPQGHCLGSLGAVDVLEQQGELVPAKTCERVAFPRQPAQSVADADEQLVAGLVAEAVVRHLEAVDVGEQDGVDLARAVDPLEGVLQPVEEDAAIGQAGERVVEGVVFQRGRAARCHGTSARRRSLARPNRWGRR